MEGMNAFYRGVKLEINYESGNKTEEDIIESIANYIVTYGEEPNKIYLHPICYAELWKASLIDYVEEPFIYRRG